MEETKAPKVMIDQTPEPDLDEAESPDVTLASAAAETGEAPAATDAEQEPGSPEEAPAGDAGDAPAEADAPAEGDEAAGAAERAEAIQPQAPAATPEAERGFSAWLTRNFPGHEHAVLGGFCGLATALLVFAIGVARVLFMLVLITIGVVIGQYLDGDDRIVRIIRSLLGGDQS